MLTFEVKIIYNMHEMRNPFKSENTLNLNISNENLKELIRKESLKAKELRQVSQRLNTLLEDNLKLLRNKHKISSKSAAEATRLALSDTEYGNLIEEYLDLKEEGFRAFINAQTHRMLLGARKSNRLYAQVREGSRT